MDNNNIQSLLGRVNDVYAVDYEIGLYTKYISSDGVIYLILVESLNLSGTLHVGRKIEVNDADYFSNTPFIFQTQKDLIPTNNNEVLLIKYDNKYLYVSEYLRDKKDGINQTSYVGYSVPPSMEYFIRNDTIGILPITGNSSYTWLQIAQRSSNALYITPSIPQNLKDKRLVIDIKNTIQLQRVYDNINPNIYTNVYQDDCDVISINGSWLSFQTFRSNLILGLYSGSDEAGFSEIGAINTYEDNGKYEKRSGLYANSLYFKVSIQYVGTYTQNIPIIREIGWGLIIK